MRRRRHNPARRARGALAFTLLELLVAVGASVLIALALAQLFKTTGDTVTKGRRAAYFNSYAAMIQRTLSQDFASMSRNGFLLIRHETTNNGANNPVHTRVGLFRGQPASLARARRIDEIMFFVEGRYASAREPAHPSLVARSSQARVYYGHGTVSPEIPASSNFHFTNAGAFGNPNELAGRLGQPGLPNAFASDWILLRHQTLLALPRTAPGDFPTTDIIWGLNPQPANGAGRIRLDDKDRQIRLQPAAASIFRAMNRPPQSQDFNQYPAQGGWRRPGQLLFSSGLVDIATSDLAEVRAYVMQMHNGAPGAEEPIFPWTNPPSPAPVGVTLPVPQSYTPRLPDALAGPGNQQRLLYNMHAWMRNAMPTNSHADPFNTATQSAERPRTRIRAADSAVNLPAILADQALGSAGRQMQRSDLLSNERMLLASSVVPHCTEFIVEWSFGEVNPLTGQTIWYGTSIPRDTDGDGQAESIGYTYYDYNSANDPPVTTLFVDRLTGQFTTNPNQHPVDPRLIYGQGYDDRFLGGDPRALVAHFGFTDPTYVPQNAQQLQTLPWPWPTMVRITITLTDPTDTALERTFQYVFRTPPPGRG